MSKHRGFWPQHLPENQTVKTPNGPVEFRDAGDGPPVLYFHGTGAGNDLVLVMEDSLVKAGFRLVAPNRPGYYGTPLSSGRSTADCADQAAQLLDVLGLHRI